MQKIVLPAYTDKLRHGARWVLGNIQFNIPLSEIAAQNEVLSAAAVLRDRPDIFRHKLKYVINAALAKCDRAKAVLMHYMRDRDVMEEFTDNIVDVTAADVTCLRDIVRGAMSDSGVPEADLVAWVETARLLLHLTVQHFNVIMIHGREKFAHDYTPYFRLLRMDDALAAWHLVANAIDPQPVVTTRDDILGQLKKISANYSKGVYLRECIGLMRHHPFFADVQVEEENQNDNLNLNDNLNNDNPNDNDVKENK